MTSRKAKIERKTDETNVSVEINLDGTGQYKINTSNAFLDHMIAQLSRHGLMDVKVEASGDIDLGYHHLVEDVGITLGRALRQSVGDAKGINRMALSYVPLDEALALVVVDFGGRGYSVLNTEIGHVDLGGLSGDLIEHLLESMAREGAFNLHVRLISGVNNHHKSEAIFKALARAMRFALDIDPRRSGEIPSTKGTITG